MDATTVALLTVAVIFFIGFLTTRHSPYKGKKLPPGPKGLPLLGNMLSIPERDYLKYEEYRQAYGELVTVKLGGYIFILLNSVRAMREALISQADNFSVRAHSEFFNRLFLNAGILFTDGQLWQEHRRFNLRVLRDFDAGKNVSEEAALVEADGLRERLPIGSPVDVMPHFIDSVNNVIAQLTLGERTGTEDPKFAEFQRKLNSVNQDRSVSSLIPIIFPFTMKIPFFMSVFEYFAGFKGVMDHCHDYIRGKLHEHEKILAEAGEKTEQEPRDLCDALLIERERKEKEQTPHTFHEDQILRDVEDMFLGGTTTTAMTMTWAIFLLSWHPEVQARVQEEIDVVIGRDRRPAMKDRRHMPFVSAVIDEVLRMSAVAPTGVPHSCAEDTELMGYFIPKDAMVFTNLWSIHRDPEAWVKPNEFYPEHFLTPEGEYRASDHLVPFSMGRRACIGEGLARMEIFIFFTSIFQHLSVRLADPQLDLEKVMLGRGGGGRRLLPHQVIFTSR